MRAKIVYGLSGTMASPGSAAQMLDTARIRNNDGFGMWVHEIRFSPDSDNTPSPGSTNEVVDSAFALLSVAIEYGRYKLTNDFVPLMALCEVLTQRTNFATVARTGICRLPKPMYLPPGEELVFKFRYQDFSTVTSPINQKVRVALIGTILDTAPRLISLPWFAVAQRYATASWQSTEAELVNPSNSTPLQLTRIVGYANGVVANMTGASIDSTSTSTAGLYVSKIRTRVKLIDQAGNLVLRDRTYLGDLMALHLSAKIDGSIAPNGYWIADVETDFSSPISTNFNVVLGIVGSQTVELVRR